MLLSIKTTLYYTKFLPLISNYSLNYIIFCELIVFLKSNAMAGVPIAVSMKFSAEMHIYIMIV